MAKFIITPGVWLKKAPPTVKASYYILISLAVLIIADSLLSGALIGFFVNFTGWAAIVAATFFGYLLYDVGNTLVRNRKIAKDIGYGMSIIIAAFGIWAVIEGTYIAGIVVALSLSLTVLLSTSQTSKFFNSDIK
jgi:energy-coupling factor transporter transmembrane protein EcfT